MTQQLGFFPRKSVHSNLSKDGIQRDAVCMSAVCSHLSVNFLSIWVYVVSCIWLAVVYQSVLSVRPSILCGNNFNIECNTHFLSTFFHIAILIQSIDNCHFISLLVTLTSTEGHNLGGKQNLLVIFSHTFQMIRMKFDVVMCQ